MQGKRKLLRGHYNPVNWSRKQPNLQWAMVKGKRVRICTQCMRTTAKTPRPKVVKSAAKTA